MAREFYGEVSKDNNIMGINESLGRVLMLKNIRKLLHILQRDYVPGETKGLLTAYERK